MIDTAKVALLLKEAANTHHAVYRFVAGDDPDWAIWYAEWLVDLSDLPRLLGGRPVKSELVYVLVGLEKGFSKQSSDLPWEEFYATGIAEHFSNSQA